MWKNHYLNTKRLFIYLSIFVLMASSCGKDKYYEDGGKAIAAYNGNLLQYLESKPGPFDSVVTIIKLAQLEEPFTQENITFFAPTDYALNKSIRFLNSFLYSGGKDTIKTLADISPDMWKKYLQMYMFRGSNKLKDYYQIDFTLINVFGGQNYYSYNNTIFNIGVVYNDVTYTDDVNGSVKGIKYAGYRQIVFSYITDLENPLNSNSWYRNEVATSDIQPNNGVIHVLNNNHIFGFGNFYSDVYASK